MSSAGVKRPLDDDQTPHGLTSQPSELPAPGKLSSVEPPSSPLSSAASALERIPDDVRLSTTTSDVSAVDGTAQNPKRRKLTPAEKEAAKADKERKVRERAEQQAQKEADRQRKLEEKKQRDEDKEEKRKIKEAEKAKKDAEKAERDKEREEKQRQRDAEKQAADEAKAKQERKQLRLNNFFSRPKVATAATTTAAMAASPAGSRRGSVSSTVPDSTSPYKSPLKKSRAKFYLPYEAPQLGVVTIAPYYRFERDAAATTHCIKSLDADFAADSSGSRSQHFNKRSLCEVLRPLYKRARYEKLTSLREVMAGLRGTEASPVDLTSGLALTGRSPRSALCKIRLKSFKYKEDVRPPYIGTCTKTPNMCSFKQLSRRPFQTASSYVNYDYDSEAEWEEPEEGEDITSDNEEEPDEDDGEDMEGFLDDEGAEATKKVQVMGEMEPISTAMHWEASHRSKVSDRVAFGRDGEINMGDYGIECFLAQPLASIDPFCASYWEPGKGPMASGAVDCSMAPPRKPLDSIPGAANLSVGLTVPVPVGDASAKQTGVQGGIMKSRAGRQPIAPMPTELMEDFKSKIAGSILTKVGLVEYLKSEFPAISRNTIQHTLEHTADRAGSKASGKRWVLR